VSGLTPARKRPFRALGAAALLVACGALAPLLGLGCRERVSGSDAAPSLAACAEVGQRCEVSPGKLGSCVLIDGCRQDNCYVCQSQH
jgi:hypothetical protein